jgi:hypothetical protein
MSFVFLYIVPTLYVMNCFREKWKLWSVTIFTQIQDDLPFTIFNFQENTYIHISQVFMSLIVCIFNILELNNHLS